MSSNTIIFWKNLCILVVVSFVLLVKFHKCFYFFKQKFREYIGSVAVKMRLLNICLLVLSSVLCTSASASGALLDRLVLEVNGVTYSQRQLELYLVTKDALRKPISETLSFVGKSNWSRSLERFINDMVISQEAQRFSGYTPSDVLLNAAKQTLFERREADLIFATFFKRMSVSDSEVRFIISRHLKLTEYLRSRNRKSEAVPFIKSAWFLKLKDRAVYRIYKGGDAFKEINPSLLGHGFQLDLEGL
tara:strand:+ start:304 stop:1044 length:741 start_codon:yes stop_codon:yes gene_type:complete